MSLILYSRKTEGPAGRLREVLRGMVSENELDFHRTTDSLIQGLLQLPDKSNIVILVINDREELQTINSIRNFLQGHRLIFIIPDQEEETIKGVHRMRPRFLTYLDCDFTDLTRVLQKMGGFSGEAEGNPKGLKG